MRKSAQTVIRPDAYYTIAAANGRVLEVADFNTENGASVRLWSYEGQPWQQWQFVEAGDGEYRIRNRFTGKVMDLAGRRIFCQFLRLPHLHFLCIYYIIEYTLVLRPCGGRCRGRVQP